MFQALFMTPELRSSIFSLPLCENSLAELSPWLPEGQKRDILQALQELFVKLAFIDERAISTANLTRSFGWTGEEVVVQHDVQELSRVFFDCLDRALQGTSFSELISNYCKGKFINVTICSICGNESAREEVFGDIGLKVKNCKNVYESLDHLVGEDILDGSNQYFCELCDKKANAIRLTKIHKLPQLLTLSLNRFEYDMKTYERQKITQNFEYPLEIDMGRYCQTAGIYELFAVIIHGGSAHSGHYHAYIRDMLGEGNWNPGNEPQVATKEVEKPKNQKKNKQSRRNKKKKNKGQNKKKQDVEEDTTYEFRDLARPCMNEALQKNWFDFNDSVVTAIRSGKLQKQFGGSNETAYMLIYRDKNLEIPNAPVIPRYWENPIKSINDSNTEHRIKYEELKNFIELQIQTFELFDINDDALVYKNTEVQAIQQGIPVKFRQSDTVEDLKNTITVTLIDEIEDVFTTHQVYIAQPLSNKCAHLLKPLDSIENSKTLKESAIWHKACLLVLPRGDEVLERILDFTGEVCEPIIVNCYYEGDKFSLLINKAWTVFKVKEKIHKVLGLPLEKIELKMRKAEGGDKKISRKDEDSTLNELKFYHSMNLTILPIEEHIPMVELKKNDEGEGLVTILLNEEATPDKTIQHLVISQWKVKDLIEDCRKVFNVPEGVPLRLRKLVDRKVICKEDIDNYLKNIPEFMDGGYRFQVEKGEPPAYGLIVIKVALSCDDEPKELFIKETDRISEVKQKASEVLGFAPDGFKMYRTDWLKEPISALKQENYTLFKAAVKDGDLLLAKPIDTVLDTEMVKMFIYINTTESPCDIKQTFELSLPEDTQLKQLKEMLLSNQEINPRSLPFMRIREVTKTLWPGKVYKEDSKGLKKLSISFGANLLAEPKETADPGSFTGIYIYLCERNTIEKKIENIVSSFFDAGGCPNIDHLYDFAIKKLGKDWDIGKITLARFKSQSFEWEIIKDDRKAEERGKLLGAKANNTGQGIYNLKKGPYFLKDGDLITVKFNGDEENDDDFVCEGDAKAREEYFKRKQASKKTNRPARPEKSIKIGDF